MNEVILTYCIQFVGLSYTRYADDNDTVVNKKFI